MTFKNRKQINANKKNFYSEFTDIHHHHQDSNQGPDLQRILRFILRLSQVLTVVRLS